MNFRIIVIIILFALSCNANNKNVPKCKYGWLNHHTNFGVIENEKYIIIH